MKKLYFLLTGFCLTFTSQAQLSLVKDIFSGVEQTGIASSLNKIVIFNNKIYFKANENGFAGLYESDGTPEGTLRLSPYDKNDIYDELVSTGTFLAWRGPQTAGAGDALWSRNEASNSSIGSNMMSQNFFAWNNEVYYSGYTPEEGFELWKTNGTASGTKMLKNIQGNLAALNPSNFTPHGNFLYFLSSALTSKAALWRTDGTTNGTVKITDIGYADKLISTSASLFFTAPFSVLSNDSPTIWKSDGTSDGTKQVKNINPSGNSYIGTPVEFNNIIYFRADNGINGIELWKSDGSEVGTQMVRDIYPSGTDSNDLHNLKIMGKTNNKSLFFTANDGINGYALWKVDGPTGTVSLVKDIDLTDNFGSPKGRGVTMNDRFYFAANDGINGEELWRTDGTASGTEFLGNINPDSKDAYPQFLTVYKNNILFVADDGIHGRELWKYTDTPSNPCGNHLTLSDITTANLFKSENDISSTQIIAAGSSVNYQAASFIQLNPGFQAASGSTFSASIKGCN